MTTIHIHYRDTGGNGWTRIARLEQLEQELHELREVDKATIDTITFTNN